jgi:hypothetical protein
MGISRGFWRLSLVVGVCTLLATILWIDEPIGNLSIFYDLPLDMWLRLIGVFGVLPAASILAIGWVVAGFRNSN